MSNHYRLLCSAAIVSLAAVAYIIPQTILSSQPADSAPTIVAGMKIDPIVDIPAAKAPQTIVLAGGCFWGMEAVFENLKGVSNVVSGYSGGTAATANYDAVSGGTTDHAEAVQITYDPAQISYGQLLKIYFLVAHNPTQINRQETDIGTQYRSALFFANPEQEAVAQAYIDQLNQALVFPESIATKVVPLTAFYPAEERHQDFIVHHPKNRYVMLHDLPKLARLQQQFPSLIQPSGQSKHQ
jgi:peptide-methionine (S)-S-oxide reductase